MQNARVNNGSQQSILNEIGQSVGSGPERTKSLGMAFHHGSSVPTASTAPRSMREALIPLYGHANSTDQTAESASRINSHIEHWITRPTRTWPKDTQHTNDAKTKMNRLTAALTPYCSSCQASENFDVLCAATFILNMTTFVWKTRDLHRLRPISSQTAGEGRLASQKLEQWLDRMKRQSHALGRREVVRHQ
jgi:hypothetical protein